MRAASIGWRTLALAALALAAQAGPGHAQATCDWYAKTALRQQIDNERMKCGFTGQSWNADLKAHAAWCASVPPDAWKSEAQKRDQQLARCAKK